MNEVLNGILETHLSAERYITPTAEREITAAHGADIAAKAKEVFRHLMEWPKDPAAQTMDAALGRLHDKLDRDYAWLTEKARRNVIFAFVMNWK